MPPFATDHTPAWPLAAVAYTGFAVVATVDAPAAVGIAILVAWSAATLLLTRAPGRVLFAALAVGGAAKVLQAVTGASGLGWGVVVGAVACVTIHVADARGLERRGDGWPARGGG